MKVNYILVDDTGVRAVDDVSTRVSVERVPVEGLPKTNKK